MHAKEKARRRRSAKTRAKTRELGKHCVRVHRTPRHVYVQLISRDGSKTLVSASTLDKEIRSMRADKNKTALATEVGHLFARRVLEKGITDLAFDRSGFSYHGRIKALADAARSDGLKF